MGRVKNISIERDEAISMIERLRSIFADGTNESIFERLEIDIIYYSHHLELIEKKLAKSGVSDIEYFRFINMKIADDYYDLERFLTEKRENIAHLNTIKDKKELFDILRRLKSHIRELSFFSSTEYDNSYNSSEYYVRQLSDLFTKKEQLEKMLEELMKNRQQLSEKVSSQEKYIENRDNKIRETRDQLEQISSRLLEAEKELQERKKKEEFQKIQQTKMSETLSKYENQLRELSQTKKQLEVTLQSLEENRRSLDEKMIEQEEELRIKENDINETKIRLKELSDKLAIAEKELSEKKKREDAQVEWEKKISETFGTLTIYLRPIEKEHRRIRFLHNGYKFASVLLIALLILLEIVIYIHLLEEENMPKLIDYLPFYAPIPLCGALLWAFITQMNRTQRQMVNLAKYIHSVKYVEGLLLSLNALSTNIEDAVVKINKSVNKLLDNHLSFESEFYSKDSEDMQSGISNVTIESLMKLLEQIKNLTKQPN